MCFISYCFYSLYSVSVGVTRVKTAPPSPKKRAQTAKARTEPSKDIPDNKDLSLEDSDDEKVLERSPSPASTVSTLKNTKTLNKYRSISANRFKENGKFPADWYLKCIPASDAAVHNARMLFNKKKAPSPFNFLAKIRDQEIMEKKLKDYTANVKVTVKTGSNDDNDAGIERMSLICEDQVKPVQTGLSRRRLREIANDATVERAPSRNTEKHLAMVTLNNIENMKVSDKVKEFCQKIEDIKSNEIKKRKEREEARRRAEEERAYQGTLVVRTATTDALDETNNPQERKI